MQITGKLKVKFDTVNVSDKFKKREFVVTTDGDYPQDIIIQLTNDKTVLIENINVGDSISVDINIRGREWNGKNGVQYFNTIEAWRVKSNENPF